MAGSERFNEKIPQYFNLLLGYLIIYGRFRIIPSSTYLVNSCRPRNLNVIDSQLFIGTWHLIITKLIYSIKRHFIALSS